MKAILDLSEVEHQLKNCKPGDEYTITFTVDAKTDEELTGTASEVEHLSAEGDSEQESTYEEPTSGKKVPRAILMVSK